MLTSATGARAATVGFDPAFGGGNPVLTPIGAAIGAADARANAATRLADGRLIVAGYARDGRNNKFALARYNPDGSLDPSFGSNGLVMTQVGSGEGSDDQIKSLVVQGDGKLVVAGFAATGAHRFALARYNPDGSPDTTFHPDGTEFTGLPGTVLTEIGNASVAHASSLVLQPDGKLVAAGWAREGPTARFGLIRYNPDASLDTTFGSGGRVLTPVGTGGFAAINSLLLQPDGKLVAAGVAAGAGNNEFALARYNPDGSLDATFGAGGLAQTQVGSADAVLHSLAVDSTGRFVAAGSAQDGPADVFALARYNPDGSLDTSFGGGGTVLTPIGADNAADALALTVNGSQLLAAGVASDAGVAQFALARYQADGTLDTTFNSSGTLVTPIGDGSFAAANALLLVDDRPLAVGYARNGGGNVFALARYVDLPAPAAGAPGPSGAAPSRCFQRLQVLVCPGATESRAPGARCRVRSRSARMSRKGRVKIRLRCAAAAKGTLTLARGKRRLGRRSFSAGKASSRTISVKLSKRARRMVRKSKRLRVRARLSERRGAGVAAASTSKSLTIRASR